MNDPTRLGRPRTRKRGGGYWLLGLLTVLGLTATVLVATLLFGQRAGEEFCPDTFARRTFFYFQIPLLGIQVTPIFRDDTTNSLENHLITFGFVKPGSKKPARWDLVRAIGAGSGTQRGDAEILCSYLDATDANGGLIWRGWSDKHSERATLLWPLVAELARQQLYFFVPELFDLARGESDPKTLDLQLRQSLARQYHRLATTQQQLGNHEMALDLLNHACEHSPEDAKIRRSREASLRALGKTAS